MVDVIKSLGSIRRGQFRVEFPRLHESVINYAGISLRNSFTCCHEESAVGIAHGYAKIEGKPMAVLPTAPWACSMPRWPFSTRT